MPFDTLQRSHKRIRSNTCFIDDDADIFYYSPPSDGVSCFYDNNAWPFTTTTPILPVTPYLDNNTTADLGSLSSPPPTPFETSSMEDNNTIQQHHEPSSPSSTNDDPSMFSKLNLSYTELGINMEARLSSATDLRMLIDTFSKLCTIGVEPTQQEHERLSSPSSPIPADKKGIIVSRNTSSRTRPVNHFKPVTGPLVLELPQMISLRQVTDACVHTYFECWVRYMPVLHKSEFLEWYQSHPSPTDTLIVNALCAFVFRHMVVHHNTLHPDLQEDQEAFFLSRARDCLAQSFDCPDRHTVVALLFIGRRAEPSRRHYYASMAMACLHELEIYPRMIHTTTPSSPKASDNLATTVINDDVDEEQDDEKAYAEEMDTRLWWYAWGVDFSLYSSGTPKSTPQPRCPGQIDLPRVFEQDIDDGEWGVLMNQHCLRFWRIQAGIVQSLYANDDRELTVDELNGYDKEILDVYEGLPAYLRLESGFEYGDEELFVACLRVNVEFNATRLILHTLFMPEDNDPHPSPFALESLNICLSMCLRQLRTLNTYFRIKTGHCGFDRDELWRAAEVITTAMDIYRATGSPAIVKNIDIAEFNDALERALAIIKKTRDYQIKRRDWLLLADWLQSEIQRHERQQRRRCSSSSSTSTTSNQHRRRRSCQRRKSNTPDHYLANLKYPLSPPPPTTAQTAQQYQQQQQQQQSASASTFVSYPSSSPTSTPPASNDGNHSPVNTIPEDPFIHFTPASPSKSSSRSTSSNTASAVFTTSTKGQTRFRYFNPRKMNKFLFIDENPALSL
ncbi:hypothetical protein K492DRAFT_176600 [Lichtheimia hyalospora FSU 10163]|nr:hypothetical protein K492DRAFT_176600 [Lichtheimia hyalospora FSU 10163]